MSCFFILILIISVDAIQSQKYFSLKAGSSVTIPCRYNREYIRHKKYWSYGTYFISSTIQAYANYRKGKVTVTDNPAESFFTVTMKDVQTENTGWYWCAVELNELDVKEALHITVKSEPDLSVRESRVRGEEGGSVTVQCLYSAAYQNTQKQWCRFKDKQCWTFTKSETSQNSAVHIIYTGNRSFNVQRNGLKKTDAGWYWCSAGYLQVPVHINVTDPPPVNTTVTTTVTTTTHQVKSHISVSENNSAASVTPVSSINETIGSGILIHWYLLALLLPLVILVIIICMLRKKCEAKNQTRTRESSNDTTVTTATFIDEDSIIYSTVAVSKSKSQKKPTYTAEDSIIYSTVATGKSKGKKKPIYTDDVAIIYSNVATLKRKSSASKVNEQDETYSSVNTASKNKTVSPNDVANETLYSSDVYQG